MADITYTPKREIITGGGVISIDLEEFLLDIDGMFDRHLPLGGGAGENVFKRLDKTYQLRTTPIYYDQLPLFREWEASCAAGELFTLDPWGNATTPGNFQLVANTYQEQKNNNFYYQISCKLREIDPAVGGSYS